MLNDLFGRRMQARQTSIVWVVRGAQVSENDGRSQRGRKAEVPGEEWIKKSIQKYDKGEEREKKIEVVTSNSAGFSWSQKGTKK